MKSLASTLWRRYSALDLCPLDPGATFGDLGGVVNGDVRAKKKKEILKARFPAPLTLVQSKFDGAGQLTAMEMRAYLVQMRKLHPGASSSWLGQNSPGGNRKSRTAAYFSSCPVFFFVADAPGDAADVVKFRGGDLSAFFP